MQLASKISKHAFSSLRETLTNNDAIFVARNTFLFNNEKPPFLFCHGSVIYCVFNVCIVCLLDLHSVMFRFIVAVTHDAFCLNKISKISIQLVLETLLSSMRGEGASPMMQKIYFNSITRKITFLFHLGLVFLRCFNVFIACLLDLFSDVQIQYCCDTFRKILLFCSRSNP